MRSSSKMYYDLLQNQYLKSSTSLSEHFGYPNFFPLIVGLIDEKDEETLNSYA